MIAIAPIPQDAQLPGLNLLLDEAAMIEATAKAFADGSVIGMRPRYIRYKPATGCLVQYDLRFTESDGSEHELPAQVRIWSDDRARSRFHRRRFRALRAETAHDSAALLPKIGGLLQLYPLDYDLPALVALADPIRSVELFQQSLPTVSMVHSPELIRYKPARKALLRYELSDGSVSGCYGKLGLDGRAQRLATQTAQLIAAGFPTPKVVTLLPDLDFIAHEIAGGLPLASLRMSAEYYGWMEPLLQSLTHLQRIELPELHRHSLADEARLIAQTLAWLGRIVPKLAARLQKIGEVVIGNLHQVDDDFVTAHGDFYDDQILVAGDGITMIDLDELRSSHPLLDIGNMLAHMRTAGMNGLNLAQEADAFRAAALTTGSFSESELVLFEAIALVKLMPGPFRRLEPSWPESIERMLETAEALILPRSSRSISRLPIDPALPQLKDLLNRGYMGNRLQQIVGDQTLELDQLELVRHKAGRRAIVRYDTRSRTHGPQTFFAKAFGSQRGPKVYEIAKLITDSRAFGERVALPRPYAFVKDLNLLVQGKVPGEPIDGRLLAGDIALAERIADIITTFHSAGLDLGRYHDAVRELAPLASRVEQIRAASPLLGELAQGCLKQLGLFPVSLRNWRSMPVHRDFYDAQVLIDGDRLSVLDLDDAAMSEPAVDIANFAAHLKLMQFKHEDARLGEVAAAFLNRAHSRDRELDPILVQFLIATTLVRLAGIHIGRLDGLRVGRLMLEAAAVNLDSLSLVHC